MKAGQVSGFTKLEDIFSDDIHLNPYGMYFHGLPALRNDLRAQP
jgi:hypothetical protein